MTVPRLPAHDLWHDGLSGNARRVAQALRAHGPSTRAQLMARTGLSRPTVSATVTDLTTAGLITEEVASMARPGGGRPASALRLARSAGLAVGVDVGRRHVRVAAADLGHEVVAERGVRLDDDADDHPDETLDLAADLVDATLDDVSSSRHDVVGVGLGIPVPVTRAGRIGSPTLMPAWAEHAPGVELAARLGLPVAVDNDANFGALGEYVWGAGRGCPVLVYVKIATGIGAGIVIGGQLFRGSAGTAGELGHVTLDARGPVCRCGNRGCVELSAGGRALLEHARLTYSDLHTVEDLVQRAEDGDPSCRRLLVDGGTQLGIALGGLVNLVNPDRIVLGGELGTATAIMLDPLRRGLADTGMPAAVNAVQVMQAALGDRASALGGVAAVLTSA